MKALLIVTLVSGLSAEPTVYPTVESCMEAKASISSQAGIKDATCVPHQDVGIRDESDMYKFRNMMDMFLEMIEVLKMQEDASSNGASIDDERPQHEYSKCRDSDQLRNWFRLDSEKLCGSSTDGITDNSLTR